MKTIIDIKKVAAIAKLNLTEEEQKRYSHELEEVLKVFSKIDQADVANVQPMFHPVEIQPHLRKDEVRQGITQEEALSLGQHKNGYFKGPRIL